MFFMDGTQKKMKLSRKVITHPSFGSFNVCEIKKITSYESQKAFEFL